MKGCEFCQIVAGRSSTTILHEWPACIAFFPLKPATPGHTLVVPKLHVEHIWDLNEETTSAVFSAAVAVAQAQRNVFAIDGMNIINSTGRAATQTVPHLHVHVLPRYTEDLVSDWWPDHVSTEPAQLDELARDLTKSLRAETDGQG